LLIALLADGEDCNPSESGRYYIGHTAVTVNGRTCQAWSSQYPHNHTFTRNYMFADGSVESARNYCRNPAEDSTGLWCFTTDRRQLWERCHVPLCSGQLLLSLESTLRYATNPR